MSGRPDTRRIWGTSSRSQNSRAKVTRTPLRTCPDCNGQKRTYTYKIVNGQPKRESKACKRCKGAGRVKAA